VENVAPGRTAIVFSGDVQRVERAFRTQIRTFRLGDRTFQANASEPSLPRALAGTVHGVVSLHNVPRRAMNRGAAAVHPQYTTASGSHYLSPGDFATIYNVKPLYAAGINGTGVTVAIVGRTHITAPDITAFRSRFGLPVNPPVFVVNGADPGDLGSGEDTEAYLDVEWAGAVARNATIKYVMSRSTSTTDGVDLSAQYIVNNNLAAVMSTSFGQSEANLGATENNFYNNLWAQAAAQGITTVVAAGDSGAAGGSNPSAAAGSGAAVSGLSSTPYNLCLGGTQFVDATGSYWTAATAADGSSATGYIPERAWNESGSVAGGSGLWATGGGTSIVYAKPAWQVAPGVPSDGRRDVPDVSLTAGGHDGYLIQSAGALQSVGGTSCASPAFAGIMALVVQATGQRQGNANPALYKMATAQYKGTGPVVFHDILTGSNTVPGTNGFLCGTGYDQVTGLGSVDAQALVSHWSTGAANKVTAAINAPSVNETIASGTQVAFNGAGTESASGATFTYAWSFGDGATGAGAATTHTFTNLTTASAVCTVTLTATDNTGVSASATRVITVTPAPRNTLTAAIATPAAAVTAASGAAVTFTATAKDSSATATLAYAWAFGDGTTATGASASHAYTNAGTANAAYTVTLTVTDNTGVAATATRAITVTPAPRNTLTAAVATPAAAVTAASGAAVAFTATAKDSSATATLTYAWTFGDGATATGASASHAYTNTGTANAAYTVTLTVTDNTGVTATATRAVTVTPAPAPLTVTITQPAANVTVASGTLVVLTGIATDTNPSPVLSYSWSTSIASAVKTAPLASAVQLTSGAALSVTNVSASPVVVTVTFTVTDNKGAKATATRLVTFNPAGR